jgi:hypothetical protein
MPLILGALVMAAIIMCVPAAAADAWATIRAANAGKWDLIDKNRVRRAAARQRWFDAWAKRRATRSLDAGGDGAWRPGFGAYAKDLYHGFFERRLEVAQAKRAARPPYAHDPRWRRWAHRLGDRVRDVLARQVATFRAWRGTPTPDADPAVADPWMPASTGPTATGTPHLYSVPSPARPGRISPTSTRSTGGSPMTAPVADVMTNDDARRNFALMGEGAAELAQAAAMAEAARAKIAAGQAATADAMSGTAFDSGAVAAVANIGDLVDNSTLANWCEIADNVGGYAQQGHAELDKYRDAEALVAQTGVHTDTLAPTSS